MLSDSIKTILMLNTICDMIYICKLTNVGNNVVTMFAGNVRDMQNLVELIVNHKKIMSGTNNFLPSGCLSAQED